MKLSTLMNFGRVWVWAGIDPRQARAARNVGQRWLVGAAAAAALARGACSRARSAQSARSEVDGARCARRRRQLAVFMVQPRLTGVS